jgi:hypothetical protein
LAPVGCRLCDWRGIERYGYFPRPWIKLIRGPLLFQGRASSRRCS